MFWAMAAERASYAFIVYPMNALANSQREELEKALLYGFGGKPPVTFQCYTGQEDSGSHTLAHPTSPSSAKRRGPGRPNASGFPRLCFAGRPEGRVVEPFPRGRWSRRFFWL